MGTISLKVMNSQGAIFCSNDGENEVSLLCNKTYLEGDCISISCSVYPVYLGIQVDDGMSEALVYLTTEETKFIIPVGEKCKSYSPKAFSGDLHLISARVAMTEEINTYRNLAKNVMDQHENTCCFPHATANVETRGEAVFAARNAIDGVKMNLSHGGWPYQSWGINRQEDAEITVDFGRSVDVDKIVLTTRADFPHDNWWEQVTVTFSDNTSFVWHLEKQSLPHVKTFEKKDTSWVRLSHLIKADDPSPFPALTQIEVYGI